ncbi:hypothetical protein OSTOST_11528 [Ostertagia ostertagi]
MDMIKTICCCGGEDNDGLPYERFYDDSSVTPVRRDDGRLNGRGVDEVDSVGWDASRKAVKSKEEQEEEALNRILENTQHNIIDVSHLDGMTLNTAEYLARAQFYEEAIRTHDQNNIIDVSHLDGMTLNTAEYLARAQFYEEAIRTHDQNVSRGANSSTSPSRPVKRLLEDCGNRAVDWLTRPAPSHESLEEIRRWTAEMNEAVTKGIQVQHKTDIVVYMDL